MNSVNIGSAAYASITAAFAALLNIPAPQIVQVNQSLEAPAAFGTLAAMKDATIVVSGVRQPGGSLPELKALGSSVRLAWGKGIINIEQANDTTIQNLMLTGVRTDPDSNGAAIRINEGAHMSRIKNVIATNNENGILATTPDGTILIEDSVFDRNGQAQQDSRRGFSHNVYLSALKVEALRSTFTNSAFGHDFKTRAKETKLRQCLLSGAAQGRALDVPNGGIVYAENTVFRKNAEARQNNLVDIGAEGISDGRPEKYTFKNSEFFNDVDPGRDVQYINNRSSVAVELIDPLFTGKAAAKDRTLTIVGKVKITLTGGPLGPIRPVGRATFPTFSAAPSAARESVLASAGPIRALEPSSPPPTDNTRIRLRGEGERSSLTIYTGVR
ncbi:MAG: hypothetical protein NVSMB6_07950 [Burkholderiaceae bacterium]